MAEDKEQQLLQRANAGDFEAFETLIAPHERRLYALAWHLTHDYHDAQDVVQNAFLSAMEHLADFRGDSAFGTWITRIVVNQGLKLIRSRKLRRGQSLDELQGDDGEIPAPDFIADWRNDPARMADRNELRRVLDLVIERLPEGHRLVFVLRDVEGMSVAETAEALGLTPANVKVRLLRARLALREDLTRRFGDESKRVERSHQGHDHSTLLARATGGPRSRRPVLEETPHEMQRAA